MKRARTAESTQTTTVVTSGTRAKGRKTNKGYKVSLTKQVGFPRQLTLKHRYVYVARMTATTGATATQQFRCNGMFDPDVTNAGHQPMYFDQTAAIYDHFTVIKSKCKVTFIPEGGSSYANFGILINDDATVTPGSLAALAEQSSAKTGILTLVVSDPQTLTSYWSAVKAFGPNPLANDNLQGSASADPAEQQVWTIWVGNTTATTVNIAILVEIEYTAVWDELKDLDSS